MATPIEFGVEVDLRSDGSDVIVHHEPFVRGPLFSEWVDHYSHQGLILNVKEEGLEVAIGKILQDRGIADFFFLDQSFPFLMRTVNAGDRRAAVRVSDIESQETALALAGELDWCWIDGLRQLAGEGVDMPGLQASGFSLCLASPELHGGRPEELIPKVRARLSQRQVQVDAVCTKRPDLWGCA